MLPRRSSCDAHSIVSGINTVLVVIDRGTNALGATHKACVMARYFGARLEFFCCEYHHAVLPEAGVAQQAAKIESSLAHSRRYVDAVRATIAAQDIAIGVSVACEPSLHGGILRKIRNRRPDLVVLPLAPAEDRRRGSILEAHDWQVARACPAPMLFTRGLPWRPTPRIGACFPGSSAPALGRQSVLHHGQRLARTCRGELHVLDDVRDARLHAAPDLIVLPAPDGDGAAPHSAEIERFIESMECDFLLVPAVH